MLALCGFRPTAEVFPKPKEKTRPTGEATARFELVRPVFGLSGFTMGAGPESDTETPTHVRICRQGKQGEAIKIYPQTGAVHKSNTKISAEKHQAALGKGAREISKNTVIFKRGRKMYMHDYQDEANTEAAERFESQFDNE